MSRLTKPKMYLWLVYVLWAIFVNVVNAWIITPLVEDFAFLGVIGVLAIIVIWLSSIRRDSRKRWIGFTIFSLMLGQGLSWLAFYPLETRIPLGLIMFVGLFVVTWLFTKVSFRTLLVSGVVLALVTTLLPVTEWPFLTHFQVEKYGRLSLVPGDMPALPFATINTPSGQAVITLERVIPSKTELQSIAQNATQSSDELGNVLRTYQNEYRLIKLSDVGGKVEQSTPTPEDLAKVDPFDLIGPNFPFSTAHWLVLNHEVVQYMSPSVSPQSITRLGINSGLYTSNMLSFAQTQRQTQLSIWNQLLNQLGVSAQVPEFQIQDGHLVGTYHGQKVSVPVSSTAIVASGSFTKTGSHQVLVEGANLLQVVDLDLGKVVANYRANINFPLPNDIVTGPLLAGGPDAIFINASPAYILVASANGTMNRVYVAPNQSLRFEADIQFAHDTEPEIITDDPSYLRDSPIRYFTSYTYRNHNLIRNWRVYRTNVVNVHPVQFTYGSIPDITVGIYGTGQYLVLKRVMWPMMQLAVGILVLVVLIGWILRYRERGRRTNA